jgi:hypothetical protein
VSPRRLIALVLGTKVQSEQQLLAEKRLADLELISTRSGPRTICGRGTGCVYNFLKRS